MRIVIIGDEPVWTDGGRHSMPNPMNRFFERLAIELGEVVFCGGTRRVSQEVLERACIVDSSKLRYAPRPFYDSPLDFLLRSPWLILPTLLALWRAIRSADLVYLRLPSLVGVPSYLMVVAAGRPRIVQIKGSWRASAANRYRGPLGVVSNLLIRLTEFGDSLIARRSTTMVHTLEQYNRLRAGRARVEMVVVSLVSAEDIYYRVDTCEDEERRLLWVGRVSPAKGLEFLLQAMTELPEPRPVLRLIGSGPDLPRLRRLVRELGLNSLVRFEGNVEFGAPLMEAYQTSDVFVLPSLTEGIPKVIFEAMASGLPIIATEVGGVPQIIKNRVNGLLIQPQSVPQIRDAVSLLLSEPKLRRKLISNGYETVRSHTIEESAGHIARLIRQEVA